MSRELEELRAEVAALRAEVAGSRGPESLITRRRLLTGLTTVGAAGAAGIAAATPAGAADGDNLVLGQENLSEATTQLRREGGDELPPWSTGGDSVLHVEDKGGEVGLTVLSSNEAIVGAGGISGLIAFGAVAIVGESDHLVGVEGKGTDFAIGVYANSAGAPALYIESTSGAHLYVKPSLLEGPPANGTWEFERGSVFLDANTDAWLCTATGPPPTWTRLLREDTAVGRVIPITPIRVLDTRATSGRATGAPAVPGQKKGPLTGGGSVTLDLAGVAPIPTTATGVVGNATVLTPDGNGFLRILPAGASVPASSFNFQDGITIANGFTSGLSPTGLRATAPISSSIRYHLVIDIAAYIT